MKITKDQATFLETHYQKYSDAKLAKAMQQNKNWVYLAMSELQLERSGKNRVYIQQHAKKTPPTFIEKTNVLHITIAKNFAKTKELAIFIACIAAIYMATIPNFPAGIYGAELAVCATDYGLSSTASPLYLFVGNAFCYFFGTSAWQLQLLSALCMAITCGFLAMIFYRFCNHFGLAITLTTLFAFSTNVWTNAITVSPVSFAVMFFSVSLYFCVRWYESPQENRVVIIAISLIASVISHPFFAIFVPAILFFLFVAHRDYKLSKETIFSISILLFLGLNVFLVIPFASWNHAPSNAPQGFLDSIQFVIQPVSELEFTQFSLTKYSTIITSPFGFLSGNIFIGLFITISVLLLVFYGNKQLRESKPAFAKLLMFITITFFVIFVVAATTNISRDAIQTLGYLSLPLIIIIGLVITQIETKYKYVLCTTAIAAQLFINPVSVVNDNFIHTYSKHILQNAQSTIIADTNIYWPLVYNNKNPKTKIILATDIKHKQQLIRQNPNATCTYVDPISSNNRRYRNGLLWQPLQKKQDVPQWSPTTKIKSNMQQNLVSQYHVINAMHFLQKDSLNDAILQANKAVQHQKTVVKLLTRYAQQIAAKKKYDNVITIYEYLQSLFPTNANYLVAVARVKNIQGKTTEAEKYYKEALQIAPRNFYASIELAKIYEKTKRIPQAQQIYEQLTKFYPKNPYAYKKLAQIYAQNKQTQTKAAEMQKKGEQLDKNNTSKKPQTPAIPKVTDPKSMLPKLPKIPQPQDFYPKIPNPIPGRKQQ
ncbi:tetratricopeptide repeat protein [Candidatus Uabimicrobium sp. HlEnr_7]|uniref:tetratricopeptide repeat protein n=1 Tax=Candidatus Uabimicrobium helgolandensis TaxID=3095367 RepID=UPI00355910CF